VGASVRGKDMLFSYAPTFLRTYAPTLLFCVLGRHTRAEMEHSVSNW